MIKRFIEKLKPLEVATVAFYLLMTVTVIAFAGRIPQWNFLVPLNLMIVVMVYFIGVYDTNNDSVLSNLFRFLYPVGLIFVTFKEIYWMVKPIHPYDYDYWLIAIDHMIFGANPTQVLSRFANPVLTEILQVAYNSFYILPVILGVSLVIQKKTEEVNYALFTVVYGFYLSYIAYFAFPAVGPRFTLHDFNAMNSELPGLWVTNFLREVVNTGESIPSGTLNPMQVVQRDVFPSGHTMMTLIVCYLAIKFNDKTRFVIVTLGTLLIFGTVYLRYHYVVDLLGGLLAMIFSILTGNKLYKYLYSIHLNRKSAITN